MTREENILHLKNEKAILGQMLDDLETQISVIKSHIDEIEWTICQMEYDEAIAAIKAYGKDGTDDD